MSPIRPALEPPEAAAPPGRVATPRTGVAGEVTEVLRTIYCGEPHRMADGLPVGHACRVLDPAFLLAERDEDLSRAVTLLELMPLLLHPGVPEATESPRRL
jgi:hypothetical protein